MKDFDDTKHIYIKYMPYKSIKVRRLGKCLHENDYAVGVVMCSEMFACGALLPFQHPARETLVQFKATSTG
jgi:hypothetical protein